MIALLPRVNYEPDRKEVKMPTCSRFNSTSLLKSSIFSVPSNGVTNRLKNPGQNQKKSISDLDST